YYEENTQDANKYQKLSKRSSHVPACTSCLSAGSGRIRAMDTAPAIALKMTKKFRSRCIAVAPGINSTQAFIRPAIRFLTLGLARAMSVANAAIGQPVSGRSQCSVERYSRTSSFHLSSCGTFCREDRILSLESENPCAMAS